MSQASQIQQLKPAPGLPPQSAADISDTVAIMLARLRTGREDAARDYARRLDWAGVSCDLYTTRGMYHGADQLAPRTQIMKDYRAAMVAALRNALT